MKPPIKPPVVLAVLYTWKAGAQAKANEYRQTREQRREYAARIYLREVRADGLSVPVWVVVVRQRRAA